jgi:hypothetical protein
MNNTRGFALEATLFTMLLIAALIATAFTGVVTVMRTANVDYRNSRVAYAAEAGADAIMAQVADALEDGALSEDELTSVAMPELEGFTYERVSASKVGGVGVEPITDGPFAGLYSLTQRLDIFSKAVDPNGNSSSVIVSAKAQAIPIFQFGIFFDADLEITNGPRLDFDGWVHTNGNLYVSSRNAYYKNIITTPNQFIHNRKDQNIIYNGVYIDDATGTEVQVQFDSRDTPGDDNFVSKSHFYFDDRLKTNAYGVDTLRVPLPEGMPAIAVMQPRLSSDVDLVRKAKFAWKADWYIVVDVGAMGSGIDVCNKMTQIRDGGEQLPSNAGCSAIFGFGWERFIDGRENRRVDVFEIDMAQLFAFTGANPAGRTSVMYVTFINVPGGHDPSGDGVYPIVRLRNGATLNRPITVATDRPIYVWGDYNSNPTNWVPASVVGDAVTWLSNAWNDAALEHQNYPFVRTAASPTRMYMAVLAGHSATPWDWFDGGGNAPYGGGVENYPRFLETWSGVTSTYYGSLVSLSTSVYAVGQWGGSYYSPPVRDWHFDMRFENPESLPPGTPVVGNVIHTAFRPVY